MRIRIALCSLFVFLACSFALGQDISAKITGTVTDASGAVIAGATVTARETSRGIVYPTQTNAAGVYYLSPLPIGDYVLKVTASGFSSVEHPALSLVMNQTARVDVALTVGQASQTVEVSSAPPLLQTDASFMGTVLDARANVTLPLATRNYNQLTLLSPGAVSLNPGSFTGSQTSFQVGRPYINGNREQTNNYILDGMDNNQIDNNDVAFSPSVDAIQEFNLISQNAPASYGNYLGGIISVTTKSGSNQFHGDAFEFIRNDALNANTWAAGLQKGLNPYTPHVYNADGTTVKPTLRWNEFGASVGGPIIKDKLFFFVDYQGSRFDQPSTAKPYTVITTAERGGDFSAVCTAGFNSAGLCTNPAQQLYNPYSASTPGGRQPYLNNIITSALSPAATKIINSAYYPQPINGLTLGNQTNVVHTDTNSDQGDVKVDWVASQKDHVYARYSQQHISNPTTNSQLLLGNSDNEFPLYNGVLDYAHTFSPKLLNDLRFGGSYFPVTEGFSNPTGQDLATAFGIGGAAPGQTFLPGQTFNGSTYVGSDGGPAFGNANQVQNFHDTVLQIEDTATIVHDKHTINVGFEYYNYRTNITYVGSAGFAGTFTYDGSFTSNPTAAGSPTGFAEADFLLGLPQNVAIGNGSGRSMRNSLFAGFAQDDWHLRPNLTLNLGLRYEVVTPRGEAHNQATNYNLTTGATEIAGMDGNSSALYPQYNGPTNFQPRVGFSYQPAFDHAMVLRGAYGISNFSESTGTGNLLFQNPPFAQTPNVTYAGGSLALPGTTLDQGFSTFPASGCTVAAAIAQSPLCFQNAGIHAFSGVRPAVSQQWNLTVQRQLGNSSTFQISYVGQKTDHLMAIELINQKVLEPNGTISPSPYLNPTLQGMIGQARLTTSVGYSNYNALQASFQQRLSRGLEFQANYTWSKCMGNTSGFFAQYGDTNPGLTQAGNNHFFFQNTYDPAADYGRCDQNVGNSFNGFVTYDLPFGRGRQFGGNLPRAADLIAGGWQVNSILQFHTGFPITMEAPSDVSGTTSGFPRANCDGPPVETPGADSTIPNTPGKVWFSSKNLSLPTSGFGNCQVGSYTGPGLQSVDMSVSKDFHIVERQSLQFRAEAINALNHPILSAPVGTVGSQSFGLVNSAQGERNLQFALKYIF
jgi:Carboxypeptidase regulatory-like domain/TonB dependent receptor